MNSSENSMKTTFAWDMPRRMAVVLPGFLLLSLLAHAATFFLFQIVYPAGVTIEAPPRTVSLLDPSRPDHQALLRLIEAADPAPVASVQAVVPPKLLEVPYRPSYTLSRTQPRTLPETPSRVQFPPPRDPLAIIRSTASTPAAPAATPVASATRIEFSGPLAARSLVRTPPIAFKTQSSATPLEPARFLIGVNDRGEVRFVFLQRTCGNQAIDEAAAAHLTQLSFSPAETPIAWAHAAFTWGDDVYPVENPKSP